MWIVIALLLALDLGIVIYTTFKCTTLARRTDFPPKTTALFRAMAIFQVAAVLSLIGRFLAHLQIRDEFAAGEVPGLFAAVQTVSLLAAAIGLLAALWLVTKAYPSMGQTERLARVRITSPFVDVKSSELDLTARELEVMEAMMEGRLSDQEIAEAFYISPATAATHVRNILRKANLHNRRDLVIAYGASQIEAQQ